MSQASGAAFVPRGETVPFLLPYSCRDLSTNIFHSKLPSLFTVSCRRAIALIYSAIKSILSFSLLDTFIQINRIFLLHMSFLDIIGDLKTKQHISL